MKTFMFTSSNPIKTYVKECSACGGNHYVDFYKLVSPVMIENLGQFEYMGLCGSKELVMREVQREPQNEVIVPQ